MTTYRLYLLLIALLSIAACQRRPAYVPVDISAAQGKDEIAKLQHILAKARNAEDSLVLLTQAIAGYADAGANGHVDADIWRNYTLGRKLHMCVNDSVKLLCGASATLLLDAIKALTPWQAMAYNHGAPIKGVTHVTVLVNVNGKLVHTDPAFGYVMYDAATDTLLDFMNELNYLKQGRPEMLKRHQLDFERDFLLCDDSVSINKYAHKLHEAIGAKSSAAPQVLTSRGVCPYKMKVQMSIQRWLAIETGGRPYTIWLKEQGYNNIAYLVLFPLGYWTAPANVPSEFADSTYKKIAVAIK